jgi:hypothetical protein
MKKGSAAAIAWGRKMKRLRNKIKPKAKKVVKKAKGKAKKVVKKAKGKAKSSNTTKRNNNSMKLGIKIPSIAKKAALGIGGAALATAIVSVIMPNSSISKFAAPAGAFALGGIEGVIGSMAINMLGNGSAANTVVVPRLEVL